MQLQVVKVGGSLLAWPDLGPALRTWLAGQPGLTCLVVGGGAWADALRTAQTLHSCSDEQAHWLCIRAMTITARLVQALLPGSSLLFDPLAELPRLGRLMSPGSRQTVILDPLGWLLEEEAEPAPLPHTWAVTSDSIAAYLARRCQIANLVLLKSQLPAPHFNRAQAALADYVDRYFPTAAAGLQVQCVNLRQADFPARLLQE